MVVISLGWMLRCWLIISGKRMRRTRLRYIAIKAGLLFKLQRYKKDEEVRIWMYVRLRPAGIAATI
jgi:hypothetical protein